VAAAAANVAKNHNRSERLHPPVIARKKPAPKSTTHGMLGSNPYGSSIPNCPCGATGGSITVMKGKNGESPAGSKT